MSGDVIQCARNSGFYECFQGYIHAGMLVDMDQSTDEMSICIDPLGPSKHSHFDLNLDIFDN